jgi:sugar diacid utilization regulator
MREQGVARTGLTDAVHAAEVLRVAAASAATALARELELVRDESHGSLLEEIRARADLSGAELVRRASRLGCDLSRGAVMLCAELTVDRPHLVLAMIAEDHPGALAQELPGVGPHPRPRVYAALPATGGGDERAVELAARISARLERYGPVGISSFHSDPAALGAAVRESELMLDLAKRSGALGCAGIHTGTYKLLVRLLASHPDELTAFYDSTVAAMVSYDEHNRTDLVRTLDAYLNSNCNMNLTATTIFAHRHTVASRLERIRELTGLDPMRFEDREQLGLGLKVQRLLSTPELTRGRGPRPERALRALDRQQRLA